MNETDKETLLDGVSSLFAEADAEVSDVVEIMSYLLTDAVAQVSDYAVDEKVIAATTELISNGIRAHCSAAQAQSSTITIQ